MAKIYTTLFWYGGRSYTAVISQINGATHIYVPDETLHGILPQGRATFHPQQELSANQSKPDPAQRLIQDIITGIKPPAVAIIKKEEVRNGSTGNVSGR